MKLGLSLRINPLFSEKLSPGNLQAVVNLERNPHNLKALVYLDKVKYSKLLKVSWGLQALKPRPQTLQEEYFVGGLSCYYLENHYLNQVFKDLVGIPHLLDMPRLVVLEVHSQHNLKGNLLPYLEHLKTRPISTQILLAVFLADLAILPQNLYLAVKLNKRLEEVHSLVLVLRCSSPNQALPYSAKLNNRQHRCLEEEEGFSILTPLNLLLASRYRLLEGSAADFSELNQIIVKNRFSQ